MKFKIFAVALFALLSGCGSSVSGAPDPNQAGGDQETKYYEFYGKPVDQYFRQFLYKDEILGKPTSNRGYQGYIPVHDRAPAFAQRGINQKKGPHPRILRMRQKIIGEARVSIRSTAIQDLQTCGLVPIL